MASIRELKSRQGKTRLGVTGRDKTGQDRTRRDMRGGKGTASNWCAENDKLRTFEGASQRVEWITSGWCHGYMCFEWSCPGFLDPKLVLIDTFRENDNEGNGGMYCNCLLLEMRLGT